MSTTYPALLEDLVVVLVDLEAYDEVVAESS